MQIHRIFSRYLSVQICIISVLVKSLSLKLVTTIFLARHFLNCQTMHEESNLSVYANRSFIISGCDEVFSNISDKVACQNLLKSNQASLSQENLVIETKNSINSEYAQFIMDGLGLEKLPDMKKINISQHEYTNKYSEYLHRMRKRWREKERGGLWHKEGTINDSPSQFHLTLVSLAGTSSRIKRQLAFTASENERQVIFRAAKSRDNEKSIVLLNFSKRKPNNYIIPSEIEEANLKLLLMYNITLYNNKKNAKSDCRKVDSRNILMEKKIIRIKVYSRLTNKKRICLGEQEIEVDMSIESAEQSRSKWLHFDVTQGVKAWMEADQKDLRLEIKCNNCKKIGAGIYYNGYTSKNVDLNAKDDSFAPTLNIVKRVNLEASAEHAEEKDFWTSSTMKNANKKVTLNSDCFASSNKKETRCCRYPMNVVFKEVKGFEFILQPKSFDAGYCRGRCPPYYKPAHHHAMLQGLIWKQSQSNIPRPCCAPSKLAELEVLHVDEKDGEKLKISTWSDMLVVECACS